MLQHRLRATTVVIQVAAGLVLVAGAAVHVRTIANLKARNTGFQPECLIMVQLDPALEGYTRPQVSLLFDRLVEQLRQSPGASAVGTSFYPLLGSGHMEWPLWRGRRSAGSAAAPLLGQLRRHRILRRDRHTSTRGSRFR